MPLAFGKPSGTGGTRNTNGASATVGFGAGVTAAALIALAVKARLRSPLGASQWGTYVAEDGTVPDFEALLQHVADKGVEPDMRPDVWPLLLGVYQPDESKDHRALSYKERQQAYEDLMRRCQELEAACLAATATRRQSRFLSSGGGNGRLAVSGENVSVATSAAPSSRGNCTLGSSLSNSTGAGSSLRTTLSLGTEVSQFADVTRAAAVDLDVVTAADQCPEDPSELASVGHLSRTDIPAELRPYWEAQQAIAMDAIRVDFRKAHFPGAATAFEAASTSEGGADGRSSGGRGSSGLANSLWGLGFAGLSRSGAAAAAAPSSSAVVTVTAATEMSHLASPLISVAPGADDINAAGDDAARTSGGGNGNRLASWLRESFNQLEESFQTSRARQPPPRNPNQEPSTISGLLQRPRLNAKGLGDAGQQPVQAVSVSHDITAPQEPQLTAGKAPAMPASEARQLEMGFVACGPSPSLSAMSPTSPAHVPADASPSASPSGQLGDRRLSPLHAQASAPSLLADAEKATAQLLPRSASLGGVHTHVLAARPCHPLAETGTGATTDGSVASSSVGGGASATAVSCRECNGSAASGGPWLSRLARFHLEQTAHFTSRQRHLIKRLLALLSAYAVHDPSLGYCQGMSDLALPFVLVMEDDVLAFWCFARLMDKVRSNFLPRSDGVFERLAALGSLLANLDPTLGSHLAALHADHCHFAHRMVAVQMRRELSAELAVRMWEQLWADDRLEQLAAQREAVAAKVERRRSAEARAVELTELGGSRMAEAAILKTRSSTPRMDQAQGQGRGPVVAQNQVQLEGATAERTWQGPVLEADILTPLCCSCGGEDDIIGATAADNVWGPSARAAYSCDSKVTSGRNALRDITACSRDSTGPLAPSVRVAQPNTATSVEPINASPSCASRQQLSTAASGHDSNNRAAHASGTAIPTGRELFPYVVAAVVLAQRRRLLECAELDDVLRVVQSAAAMGRSEVSDALRRARDFRERVVPRSGMQFSGLSSFASGPGRGLAGWGNWAEGSGTVWEARWGSRYSSSAPAPKL